MPRAYKLPNAATVIEEINAAQSQLDELEGKARELAASIGKGVEARFRRGGFSDDHRGCPESAPGKHSAGRGVALCEDPRRR